MLNTIPTISIQSIVKEICETGLVVSHFAGDLPCQGARTQPLCRRTVFRQRCSSYGCSISLALAIPLSLCN